MGAARMPVPTPPGPKPARMPMPPPNGRQRGCQCARSQNGRPRGCPSGPRHCRCCRRRRHSAAAFEGLTASQLRGARPPPAVAAYHPLETRAGPVASGDHHLERVASVRRLRNRWAAVYPPTGASALGGRADAAWGYPGNRGDQTPGPADSKAQRRETGPPGPPGGHGPAATHRSSRRTPQAHGCAVQGSGSNVSRQPVSRSRFYITRARSDSSG